jgi:hypothetical protein
MHELQGQSGRQFDPLIVAALHDHLAHPVQPVEADGVEGDGVQPVSVESDTDSVAWSS